MIIVKIDNQILKMLAEDKFSHMSVQTSENNHLSIISTYFDARLRGIQCTQWTQLLGIQCTQWTQLRGIQCTQ